MCGLHCVWFIADGKVMQLNLILIFALPWYIRSIIIHLFNFTLFVVQVRRMILITTTI